MSDDTRARLLAAAKAAFAERGFYGASTAQVAGEVGLTKQALLYYFRRKEDLYGEVLRSISDRLLRYVRAAVRRSDSPARQFEDVFLGLYTHAREDPQDNRLLMRELLDNPSRANKVKDWYLRPFLGEIVALLQRVDGFESVDDASAFSMVYQLLGSIEYFGISDATLQRMYDSETYERIRDEFPVELRSQIHRLLASRQPAAPV